MTYCRYILLLSILLATMMQVSGQNISSLQNKKLTRLESNIAVTAYTAMMDSILRTVPGSVNGTIDSVVVMRDDEYYLKLKIYYRGFDKATILAGTLSETGKQEKWVGGELFTPEERSSPADIVFELNRNLPAEAASSSAYLYIDIWGSGTHELFIYPLQKLWTADRNIIEATLQAVGVTASLSHTNRDVMPTKKIFFNDNTARNKGSLSLNEFQGKLLNIANSVSTDPLGPDIKPFSLWDGIAVDNQVDFSRPQDISNININVYPDKNMNSGIYYILPADFHLVWDPGVISRKGYRFSISYDKQPQTGTNADTNSVHMAATLRTGITEQEKEFVSSLLKAIDRRFRQIMFLELRENMQTTFQNTLTSQFRIPAERITVNATTDLTNTMKVEWTTSPDNKEFIQTTLSSADGIAATVLLKPRNQEISDQLIPANISLADTRAFGKMMLVPKRWRDKYWINSTEYPLKLKYLHVMKKSIRDPNPVIYTWDLNNLEVPPKGKVSFEKSNKAVPTFLDFDYSTVFWISYSVMECRPCTDSVINAVTDGVIGSILQPIKFVIPSPLFDTLKVDYFLISVRSRQVDPKGEQVGELPVLKITRDAAKDFYSAPLFVPKGRAPDFEFNIKALGLDGDFYLSEKWIRWTDKEVYLGKSKLMEIFKGVIPWIN